MPARTGKAALACVIGDPVAHSLSPAIHGYWLAQAGLDGTYIPLRVPAAEFEASIAWLRARGFRGGNVTLPHKEAAFALCSQKDEAANMTGAVNTILFGPEGLHGSNTDPQGFIENLLQSLQPIEGYLECCVVLGGGGAARGVIYGLLQAGARQILLTNRTAAKAEAIAQHFQPLIKNSSPIAVIDWEARHHALPKATLLVNTTQLGMTGQPPLDLALDTLPTRAAVADLIYKPLLTPLLLAARNRGNRIVDGLGMLLHQAVPGFALWYGRTPEVTPALRAYVESLLR